jgi:hypothetical protein
VVAGLETNGCELLLFATAKIWPLMLRLNTGDLLFRMGRSPDVERRNFDVACVMATQCFSDVQRHIAGGLRQSAIA